MPRMMSLRKTNCEGCFKVGRILTPGGFDEANAWRESRKPVENRRLRMRAVNPAFIPRNHRIEEMIQAATGANDFVPFHELLSVFARPFDDQPNFARYLE